MQRCKECDHPLATGDALVSYFTPDPEPYEAGVAEDYEDGEIEGLVVVAVLWCPDCLKIRHVWIAEPQLEGENWTSSERLREDTDLETFLAHARKIEPLKEYIRIVEKLLTERNCVVEAIPECPIHGPQCVPHALEWVEEQTMQANAFHNILAHVADGLTDWESGDYEGLKLVLEAIEAEARVY